MKNPRAELLRQLVGLHRSREDILEELQKLGWDSDYDYFVIPAAAIVDAIDLRLEDSISELDLVEWAASLECREDVTYEDGEGKVLSEIVFLLSNPEINQGLSNENLQVLKSRCSGIKCKSLQ